MEEQIELLKTTRLSWDAVSRILETAVFGILRRKVRIKAWSEDADYWGALALDYRFSLEDLDQLLNAVQADEEVRLSTLPDDETSTNSFGMDLGNLLLKREQASDWAETHITKSCLWLLDYSNDQIHPYTRSGFFASLKREQLMSAQAAIDYLDKHGCTERALSGIRERYYKDFGNELCWRYPISDELHLGAFILAVQEGFLHIPFDGMYIELCEQSDMDDISLHTAETLEWLISDWSRFSDDLEDAMRAMKKQAEAHP